MATEFETTGTHPQGGPSRKAGDDVRDALREKGARDTTREQIHQMSEPNERDTTREQIHKLSEPSSKDGTREQIHNLSEPSERDSTREQIHDMKDWTLSEKLGLPLLSGDKPSAKREGGRSDGPRRNSNWFGLSARGGENEDPNHIERTQSPFSVFSRNDRWMIYAGAFMMLAPLLGGYLFVR